MIMLNGQLAVMCRAMMQVHPSFDHNARLQNKKDGSTNHPP
jgi:hypothetical protein